MIRSTGIEGGVLEISDSAWPSSCPGTGVAARRAMVGEVAEVEVSSEEGGCGRGPCVCATEGRAKTARMRGTSEGKTRMRCDKQFMAQANSYQKCGLKDKTCKAGSGLHAAIRGGEPDSQCRVLW